MLGLDSKQATCFSSLLGSHMSSSSRKAMYFPAAALAPILQGAEPDPVFSSRLITEILSLN